MLLFVVDFIVDFMLFFFFKKSYFAVLKFDISDFVKNKIFSKKSKMDYRFVAKKCEFVG